MNKNLKLSLLFFATLAFSCKKNSQEPVCNGQKPTYDNEIKSILSVSCGGSSCHGQGGSEGDFSTYTLLKPVLDNGSFKDVVLVKKTMPKTGSLSQDQLNLLQCWVENGYAEK